MSEFNDYFINLTSRDYDVGTSIVKDISEKSTSMDDFYKRMENYVIDRESMLKKHRGRTK